jgi:glycine/D-amino acid oxidase-like deaminating enzyme
MSVDGSDRGRTRGCALERARADAVSCEALTRRRVLASVAGLLGAGLAGRHALADDSPRWFSFGAKPEAAPAPRPRAQLSTITLGSPDFALLDDRTPYLAGVRPHRDGGARIELARPVETGGELRHVIHNYGHGGAGVTLAFGSAEHVVGLVERLQQTTSAGGEPKAVAILGCGVMGLTSAAALTRRWPALAVTIYASDCTPEGTTSYVAGGQFAPVATLGEYASGEQRRFLDSLISRSEERLHLLRRTDQSDRLGIARAPSYSLDTSPAGASVQVKLGAAVLPARTYETWLIDPRRLLPALKSDLARRGVAFVEREFTTPSDVYALEQPIIINCTGYGARDLFGDPALEARRGHMVVLRNPTGLRYMVTNWCGDTANRYLFARGTDIVIGGSLQPGVEAGAFDPADASDVAICERILRRARALFEKSGERCA